MKLASPFRSYALQRFALFFVIVSAATAARAQLDAQVTVIGSATGGNGNPSFNDKVDDPTDFIHSPASATLTREANAGIADSHITGTVTASVARLSVDFSASVNNFVSATSLGRADGFITASGSFTDVFIPISTTKPPGLAVVIHAHMIFTGDFNVHVDSSGMNPNGEPSPGAIVGVGVELTGTGVTSPPQQSIPGLGVGNWIGYAVDDAPLHAFTASQPPPTTIPLTIFGAIGVDEELDYRLKFTGTGIASNGFNEGDNSSGDFAGSFGHTLAWGGIDSVNDATTGEPIADISFTSASGFDYTKPVPEASSLALLSLGGLVLLVARILNSRRAPQWKAVVRTGCPLAGPGAVGFGMGGQPGVGEK
jgi:hypothetical protein